MIFIQKRSNTTKHTPLKSIFWNITYYYLCVWYFCISLLLLFIWLLWFCHPFFEFLFAQVDCRTQCFQPKKSRDQTIFFFLFIIFVCFWSRELFFYEFLMIEWTLFRLLRVTFWLEMCCCFFPFLGSFHQSNVWKKMRQKCCQLKINSIWKMNQKLYHIFCLQLWKKKTKNKSFMSRMRATFFSPGLTKKVVFVKWDLWKYKPNATAIDCHEVSCRGWLFLMCTTIAEKDHNRLEICYHITFVSMVIESWCVSI